MSAASPAWTVAPALGLALAVRRAAPAIVVGVPFFVLFFEAVVTGALAYATWRRNTESDVARALLIVLVLITVLIAAYALHLVVPSIGAKVVLFQISQSAMFLIPLPWLVFVFLLTGRDEWVSRNTIAVVAVGFAFVLGLLWTNFLHGRFYTGFEIAPNGALIVEWGVLYALAVWYAYLGLGVGAISLLDTRLSGTVSRQPVDAILVGVFIPWIAHMSQYAPLPFVRGVGPTVYALGVTGVAWYLAIFRFDVFELVPVAREEVFEAMNDAVIVVDRHERIVDANPAAHDLLAVDRLAGKSARQALAPLDDDLDPYLADDGIRQETTIAVDGDPIHLDVESRPLDAWRDETNGHVLVLRDITPITERQRRLERQNERLEEFASIVSHDLRNPLNVALGNVELLDGSDEEAAAAIEDALFRMEDIVDDVLTLARQGQTVDERVPLDLAEVTRDAWSNVETDGAGLDVRADATIRADEGRLKQLLENLFRNAIEHSSTGTHASRHDADERGSTDNRAPSDGALDRGRSDVTVRVSTLDDGFYVADDGPGIPPGRRDRVFESGYTTAEDGTGFGLAIVSEIAEAHGWSVTVTDAESGGARFEITGVEFD